MVRNVTESQKNNLEKAKKNSKHFDSIDSGNTIRYAESPTSLEILAHSSLPNNTAEELNRIHI